VTASCGHTLVNCCADAIQSCPTELRAQQDTLAMAFVDWQDAGLAWLPSVCTGTLPIRDIPSPQTPAGVLPARLDVWTTRVIRGSHLRFRCITSDGSEPSLRPCTQGTLLFALGKIPRSSAWLRARFQNRTSLSNSTFVYGLVSEVLLESGPFSTIRRTTRFLR